LVGGKNHLDFFVSTDLQLDVMQQFIDGNFFLIQNVKSTLVCSGTPTQNKISVTNMLSTAIIAGESFMFEVRNFLSPPTNRAADLIKI